jgi:hypothetical protein
MLYFEIQFWRIAKWLIRKVYGADCPTRDTDDFGLVETRCASCRAKEIIEWIDEHIELLKM